MTIYFIRILKLDEHPGHQYESAKRRSLHDNSVGSVRLGFPRTLPSWSVRMT